MNVFEVMKELEAGNKIGNGNWDDKQFIQLRRLSNGEFKVEDESGMVMGAISLCNSEKWKLYEEPQKTYTFSEMIEGIKRGKKARRKSWPKLMHPIIYDCIKPVVRTDDIWLHRHFNLEEIEATDWVLFDD